MNDPITKIRSCVGGAVIADILEDPRVALRPPKGTTDTYVHADTADGHAIVDWGLRHVSFTRAADRQRVAGMDGVEVHRPDRDITRVRLGHPGAPSALRAALGV